MKGKKRGNFIREGGQEIKVMSGGLGEEGKGEISFLQLPHENLRN